MCIYISIVRVSRPSLSGRPTTPFKHNTIQYTLIQYNTIQYNTIHANTIQYNTIQYNTIQYIQCTLILYSTTQHNDYNTVQHNTTPPTGAMADPKAAAQDAGRCVAEAGAEITEPPIGIWPRGQIPKAANVPPPQTCNFRASRGACTGSISRDIVSFPSEPCSRRSGTFYGSPPKSQKSQEKVQKCLRK